MALGATVHGFDIALSDVDRGVYEALVLQVARHPSESAGWLVARVLAYALELEEGIAFGPGLSSSDEPAVSIHDLTGQICAWIDIGTPDPARLHKASKAAERVVVYCHRDPEPWLRALATSRVHAPERIAIYLLPRELVQALADRLERRTRWTITRMEGQLYVETGDASLSVPLSREAWPR